MSPLHGQAPGPILGFGQGPVADDVGVLEGAEDLGLLEQPPAEVLVAARASESLGNLLDCPG